MTADRTDLDDYYEEKILAPAAASLAKTPLIPAPTMAVNDGV